MSYQTKQSLLLRLVVTVAMGLLLIGVVPNAKASDWDHKMILTFSQSVQVPGAVLDPGTYVIKRAVPNQPLPDVLQVSDKSETHVYALFKAIPSELPRPTEKVRVTFYETPGLVAPAVRAVYYPGDPIGEQFIYPKGGPIVMALAGEPMAQPEQPAPVPEAQAAPAPEEQPAPAPENEMAQATPPPEPPAPQQPTELPKTATYLPLIGLIGLATFAAGAGLKSAVKQKS